MSHPHWFLALKQRLSSVRHAGKTARRGRHLYWRTHPNLELLEDRRVLASVTEGWPDFGDNTASARWLREDNIFEIQGNIRANDLDYFAVLVPAGGTIKVDVEAAELEFDAIPVMRVLAYAEASHSVSSLGIRGYTEIIREPEDFWNFRAPTPWKEQVGVNSIADSSDAVVSNAWGTAQVQGVISQTSPTGFEWNIVGNAEGSVGPPPEGSRWSDAGAGFLAEVAITYNSNFSGTVNTSLEEDFGEYLNGYSTGADGHYDASFPEQADYDIAVSESWNDYWHFTPDPFTPQIGIFDHAGNLLMSNGTGHLELLVPEGGIYHVAISRNTTFSQTSDETRYFSRPYEAVIQVPNDVKVAEEVRVDLDSQEILVDTQWYGRQGDYPQVRAYWASGPERDDILSDQVIASWEALELEYTHAIPIEALAGAPAEATHLVVIADKDNLIEEIDENNNWASIALIQEPTIEIWVGDGGLNDQGFDPPNDGESFMKEHWSVWVQITNNSLIPHEFTVANTYDLVGSYVKDGEGTGALGIGKEDGFYFGLSPAGLVDPSPIPNNDVIALNALERSEAVVASVKFTNWDWLPLDSTLVVPMIQDLVAGTVADGLSTTLTINTLIGSVLEQLVEGETDDALKSMLTRYKTSSDWLGKLGVIPDAISAYETLTMEIFQYPYVTYDIDINVKRDNVPLQILKATEQIEPRPALAMSLMQVPINLAAAQGIFGTVLGIGAKGGAANLTKAAGVLAVAGLALERARDYYLEAQDPPDPNYTTRVELPAESFQDIGSVEDPRLADWIESEFARNNFKTAAYLAQNKADGAFIDKATEWQATQLLDSAIFAREAAFLATRSLALGGVISPSVNDSQESAAELVARLQQEGLSPDARAMFRDAGWTDTAIDEMVAGISEGTFTTAGSMVDIVRADAVYTAFLSMDKLRQVVDLRRAVGDATIPVPDASLEELAILRSRVDEGASEGASPAEMSSLIENYLRVTFDLIDSTNNWDALAEDLGYGVTALLLLQSNLQENGVERAINELEDAGAASSSIEYLRTQAGISREFAAQSDWHSMALTLEAMSLHVVHHWGTSLPEFEAYRLFGQLMSARSLIKYGNWDQTLQPYRQLDAFTAVAGSPSAIASMSNLDPVDGTVRVLGVAASSGSLTVNSGQPLSLNYLPNDDAVGTQRLTYLVVDPESWQFQTGFATGQAWEPLGFGEDLTAGEVGGEQRDRYAFTAARGDTLRLSETLENALLELRIVSLDSGEIIDEWTMYSMYTSTAHFVIPVDGQFLLEIGSINGPLQSYAFEAELFSTAVEQGVGMGASGLLAPGEQKAYSFDIEGTDFLYLRSLVDLWTYRNTTITIIEPAGRVLYTGGDSYHSDLMWPEVGGEFLVIVRNDDFNEIEYSFELLTEDDAAPLEIGQIVSERLEGQRPVRLFTLENLHDVAYLLKDQGTNGEDTAWWEFGSGREYSVFGYIGRHEIILVPSGDNYVLAISSEQEDPLDLAFSFETIATTHTTIELDQVIEVELPVSSVTTLEFSADAGSLFVLDSLDGVEPDEWIEIYLERPNGQIRFLTDVGWDSSPILITADGLHRLHIVNDYIPYSTTISLRDLHKSERVVPGQTERDLFELESHWYRFDVAAGQPAEISVDFSTDGGYYVDLYTLDGEWFDSLPWRDLVEISAPGSYLLNIENYWGGDTHYTLQFSGGVVATSQVQVWLTDHDRASQVGEVRSEGASQVDILHEWQPVVAEVWLVVQDDIPSGPIDVTVALNYAESYYDAPESIIHIGTQGTLSSNDALGDASTVLTLEGVDLSGYGAGDRVLVAQIMFPVNVENQAGLPMSLEGAYVEPTTEPLFTVASAEVTSHNHPLAIVPEAAGQVMPFVYDSDDNGVVGLSDFVGFVSHFGTSTGDEYPGAYRFDFNRDGRVSLADFALFVQHFGLRKLDANNVLSSLGQSVAQGADSFDLEGEPHETRPHDASRHTADLPFFQYPGRSTARPALGVELPSSETAQASLGATVWSPQALQVIDPRVIDAIAGEEGSDIVAEATWDDAASDEDEDPWRIFWD